MTIDYDEEAADVKRIQSTISRLAADPAGVPESVAACRSLRDLEAVCGAEAAALPTHPRTGRFVRSDAAMWRALNCGANDSRIHA